jgi:hypothetical protein
MLRRNCKSLTGLVLRRILQRWKLFPPGLQKLFLQLLRHRSMPWHRTSCNSNSESRRYHRWLHNQLLRRTILVRLRLSSLDGGLPSRREGRLFLTALISSLIENWNKFLKSVFHCHLNFKKRFLRVKHVMWRQHLFYGNYGVRYSH